VRREPAERALRALALLLLLAPPAGAQESDFFEQVSDYFKSETIEGVSKHAEAPTETPATVTIIGQEEIARYGFRTLADVLNFASLGSFSADDRRYELVGSRGLFVLEDFNSRILVMLNGHTLNEPWSNFAGVARSMLPSLELVERIEIVYGPSSLLYGGHSLYGIVNVVTRTGGSSPGARVSLKGGTWGTFEGMASYGRAGVLGDAEGGGTEWSVLASGGYYTTKGEDLDLPRFDVSGTDDYEAVDLEGGTIWGGPQHGTDYERAPFGFLHARVGHLSLLANAAYRRRGMPFSPYFTLYGSKDQFVRDGKAFAELKWDQELGPQLSLTARAFHDRYSYDEQDPYADSYTYADTNPEQLGYDYVVDADSRDSGAELRLSYRKGSHFLTLGGEVRTRRVDSTSILRFFDGQTAPDSTLERSASGRFAVLYAQEEWRPLDRFSFIVGGNWAYTSSHSAGAPTKTTDSKALPRLAVIYKPRPDLSIKALYGQGFRPPTIFEAAYPDYQAQIDNPDLRSERIESFEGSVIWNASHRLSLQAYGFDSTLKGLIQGIQIDDVSQIQGGVVGPTGDPQDLVGEGLLQYQSTGDVRSKGAGLSARFRGYLTRAYLNVAWARARIETPDGSRQDLPASSRWLASAGLSHEVGAWTLSLAGRYVGPQPVHPSFSDHPLYGDGTAGDFVEAMARIRYTTFLVYPVTFNLDVRNLSGRGYEIAASPVFALPRLPIRGRQILLGAEIRF
jgi:outer membrane receptor protein involved in Fe transport